MIKSLQKELKVADQLQLIFMHLYSVSERYQLLPIEQLTKLQPLFDNVVKCNQQNTAKNWREESINVQTLLFYVLLQVSTTWFWNELEFSPYPVRR